MNKEYILREHLEYNNGSIIESVTGRVLHIGIHPQGYKVLSYKGKQWYAHRVIYTLVYGEIPEGHEVDHKDRDKGNNEPDNLRLSTRCQNNRNRKAPDRANGLPTGVYKVGDKFRCVVQKDKRQYSKTCYSVDEATEWVKEKRRELHGEFYCD